MKKIQRKIILDKSEKWLDKCREIEDNDGWKRSVDSFKVNDMSGRSVNIIFRKVCDVEFSEQENRRIYKSMPIMEKRKKVNYIDGKMIISICGQNYQIGTYEDN